MFKKTLPALLNALCLLSFLLGCPASLTGVKPPLEEEGEVYLYIQPFPQEADRLRFTLEGVFAVTGDGREIPLTLSLAELKASDLRRQRLLAYGRLEPGPYIGVSFKVKKATLKVEEGDASLLLPEESVRTDFPFTINRKRAQVISLTFKYEGSVIGGFSFSPSFSGALPLL